MSETKLRGLMEALTDAARFLTAYPVFLLCFSGLLKRPGQPLWLYTLLAMAMAFASLGLSRLLAGKLRRVIWLRLAQAGMLLLSAAAGVALCLALNGTGWMCMYSGLVLALYSVLGSFCAVHALQKYEFFVAAGIYVFTVAVLSDQDCGYPAGVFIAQFVAITAAFALEYNFLNIDFLMRRRGHQMSRLPSRIRLFNLLLLFGALAVLVVVVLCRGALMRGAGAVLHGVGAVLGLVFRPLRRWWDNIEDSGDPNFGMPPDLQGEDDPENAFEMLTDDEPSNVDVDAQISLLVLLGIAVAVFCLVKFRRPILDFFRRIGSWLSEHLRALFRGLGRKSRIGQDESGYYTDVEEAIEGAARTTAPYSELRAWRKELRAYQKLPDSREKYLAGYALSVRGLQLHGVKVRPSDTPLEILSKASGVLEPEGYGVATECCNALAFSGQEQAPAWPELRAALELLRERKVAK